MSTNEFLEALVDLDDDLQESLLEALRENPEELRQALSRLGYDVGDVEMPESNNDWTVISDEQASGSTQAEDPAKDEKLSDLTNAERALYDVISTVDTPQTASEIKDLIERENADLIDQYNSFTNRGWISSKLSHLAKQGLVGKYRAGREVKYTNDISTAIRNWAMNEDISIMDLSVQSDSAQIAADTGMNNDAVATTIRSMQS
jgi:hypothetical protein